MLELFEAIFLIIVFIGVFMLMLKVLKASGRKDDTIAGREREAALKEFHRTHTRVRRKRPDLVKKLNEPSPEQMHAEIGNFVENDARKAAGSLKKIMASDILRNRKR
ncbi:MAG: hypothetical protein JXA52_07080 [Planctomycetes bacterium]|nr:hypothetical protein [Planctomycetota bacterium]